MPPATGSASLRRADIGLTITAKLCDWHWVYDYFLQLFLSCVYVFLTGTTERAHDARIQKCSEYILETPLPSQLSATSFLSLEAPGLSDSWSPPKESAYSRK